MGRMHTCRRDDENESAAAHVSLIGCSQASFELAVGVAGAYEVLISYPPNTHQVTGLHAWDQVALARE